MASVSRLARRKDASRWPRMSSTFWAVVLLTALLLLYCGQLAAGTCEIVTLDRDSSQPRRTIARQTARCACKKGQIAGTTRARPACVDAGIVRKKQWCEMVPCLEDEGCDLLVNKSGWTCTQPGGRVKTTTSGIVVQDDTTGLGYAAPYELRGRSGESVKDDQPQNRKFMQCEPLLRSTGKQEAYRRLSPERGGELRRRALHHLRLADETARRYLSMHVPTGGERGGKEAE
ncbi:chemokine-like protein TAFA-5a [Aulostomus maculatus]